MWWAVLSPAVTVSNVPSLRALSPIQCSIVARCRRWGIFIMCTVILRDGYWASVASPLFVMLLILKGSGVPLQEKQVTTVCLGTPVRSISWLRTLTTSQSYAGEGEVG